MSTTDHIKFGDGLTVTDEGSGVIRVDAGGGGGGDGIQFEVDPQAGAWLEVETTGTDSTTGRGIALKTGGPDFTGKGILLYSSGDTNSGGGIRIEHEGASTEGIQILSNGDGPINIESVGDDIKIVQNSNNDILIKNTGPGLTHILATGAATVGGIYLESGGGTFTSPQGTFGIAIEEYGAGGINIYTAGSGSDITLHTASGSIILLTLPTSSAGLPSGALWRDSGASNVVKCIP